MNKRVEYIDLIRVFAILSVIAIHINAITRDACIGKNITEYSILTFLDSITRAGVPLFFMLTGFFVLRKEEDYTSFIKRKLPKLVIPFVILSFVYYIYKVVDESLTFNMLEFLKMFTNNELCYHLWYMYTIIIIYLFIPYEKKLVDNLERKDLLRLIVTTFVIGNLLSTIFTFTNRYDYTVFSSFSLPGLLIYNNYVLLGHYLSKYDFKNKKIIYVLGVVSLLLMPLLDHFYIENNIRSDSMLTATSFLPIFYSLAIYYLFKSVYDKLHLKQTAKLIISHISKLSLYIYLIHVLVMNVIVNLLNKFWGYESFFEKILFTIIVFVLTSIISYILAIILDLIYNKIASLFKKKDKVQR